MKISVVMPVWNEEELVRRAVQSIQCQTETALELIIVDDGSNDGTPIILKALAATDRRIRILQTERAGIVSALQTGLAAARGRYIARMDADDFSHPQRLEQQARYLDTHPEIGLVACGVRYGGDPEQYRGLALFVAWVNSLADPEEISRNRFIESPLIHPSVMYRKSIVDRLGGYRSGMFPEDYELWLRWLDQGIKMARLPETLFVWHERARRLTRTDERCSTDAFYRIKSIWLARYLARHNPDHPNLMVWGAGKLSRKRLRYLRSEGVNIKAYIDIDPAKIGKSFDHIPVIAPDALPPPGSAYILGFVSSRGARAQIEAWLLAHGYRPQIDYVFGA